jgi:hypothetical protein
MSDKFDEFMEEVESDIRQEKFKDMWHKYGKIFSYGISAVLAITAAGVLWNNYNKERVAKLSERLISVQEQQSLGKHEDAQALLASANSKHHKAYHAIYRMNQALEKLNETSSLEEQKETYAQAKAIFEDLAFSKDTPDIFKKLSHLYLLMMAVDAGVILSSKDEAFLDELIQENTPWKPLAMEIKGFYLFKNNDTSKAATLFNDLNRMSNLPQGLAMRAKLMNQIVLSSKNSSSIHTHTLQETQEEQTETPKEESPHEEEKTKESP